MTATMQNGETSPRENSLDSLLERVYVINWEVLAWIVILALALFTRFYMLGDRVMSHDESLHTVFAQRLYDNGSYRHDPMMHGPILFHMTALSYFLFGVTDFTARIYTATFGVILVMFPILFRRWIGRMGATLAGLMLLTSPLLTYYSRYIRHDIPSILSGVVMFWAIMMYLNGPPDQRRRARWLYLLSAAMLWNLGSKETAYIYILVFGTFLTLYWVMRVIQRVYQVESRMFFTTMMMGFLLAGIASLLMIVVFSITLVGYESFGARFDFTGDGFLGMFNSHPVDPAFSTFLSFTGLIVISFFAIVIGTGVWVYRRVQHRLTFADILILLVGVLVFVLLGVAIAPNHIELVNGSEIATSLAGVWLAVAAVMVLIYWLLYTVLRINFRRTFVSTVLLLIWVTVLTSGIILVVERMTVETANEETTALDQPVPGQETVVAESEMSLVWLVILYGGSAFIIGGLVHTYRRGWWSHLEPFPEFDVLIVMGTLILPWTTAVFIQLVGGSSADYASIAGSIGPLDNLVPRTDPVQVGKIVIGFLAFVPMMIMAIVTGILWNWRRWIMCSLIFHALFAFFFTTVFNNIEGLASGMVYSLEYWFSQQDVRRGSQPQYYYTLVILPFYEFLPIIGSFLAMIAGWLMFWRQQRDYEDHRAVSKLLSVEAIAETEDDEVVNIDSGDTESQPEIVIAKEPPAASLGIVLAITTLLTFLLTLMMVSIIDTSATVKVIGVLVFATNALGLAVWYVRYFNDVDDIGLFFGWNLLATPGTAEDEAEDATILSDEYSEEADSQSWELSSVSFILFVAWWAVLNLIGYTLAGEKMPWLGTHMTVPMIFLSAWYFGRIFEQIDIRRLFEQGWVYILLLPLLFIGLFQVIAPFISGQWPFQGTATIQQQWTYRWLAVVVVSGGVLYGIYLIVQKTGWRHLRQMAMLVGFGLLVLITFRSSWVANFINYDEATELLVYAHAAPGNKYVIDQIRDLSLQTTDGMDLRILHDDRFSWPGSWYLRDFTNTLYIGSSAPSAQEVENAAVIIVGDSNRPKLEPLVQDRFQRFDHIRMWWPMQDYFDLSAARVNDLLDLSSRDVAARRRGIFDIWWSRDYSAYAQATSNPAIPGRDADRFNVDKGRWPVSDGMHVYIRKDIVAQVWPYGVGDGNPLGPLTTVSEDACLANHQVIAATTIFDEEGLLRQPLGLDIGPDGRLYVAESEDAASRITMFSLDGTFLGSFGQKGDAETEGAYFTRPHSVAFSPDGKLYVVDTWNYRIRVFDPATLQMLNMWGQPLTAGESAQRFPEDGFWGPRDVVVDAAGRVYVADTGNKRIRVYESNGAFVRDIGSSGTGEGQLNEPAGLAIGTGRLYVADTWNRRLAIFNLDGTFVKNVPVRGWYEEQGNRPYLAVDESRDLLYVTDPDGGRILVYNLEGECVGSFGQLSTDQPDSTQFRTVGGIAIDEVGNIYLADLGAGRVVKFGPFVVTGVVESESDELEEQKSAE